MICTDSKTATPIRRLGRRVAVIVAAVLVLLTFLTGAKLRGETLQSDTIALGMSTVLTGPNAHIGLNAREGVLAAIEEVNRNGGIKGRTLRLISLDDGYEPARTGPNIRRLIEEDGALAIVGNVGTPTAVTAIPIARDSKTPFFGALTGAGVLRTNPPDRYVINYRASYAEETSAMVEALVRQLGLRPEEIAFFTQRDAYGDAGFSGGAAALRRHGLKNENRIAHGRYERNTLAVENALADILLHRPYVKAVILVGAYAPCAEFIRLARQSDLDVPFLCVSFVGAAPLSEALGAMGEGVIVTQVVPHFNAELPIVQAYRRAMESLSAEADLDFCSLEGYVITRILCQALESVRGELTRETIVDALEDLGRFEIGLGVPLQLSRNEHQACHRVWPTVLSEGKFVPFEWRQLGCATGAQQ